MAFIQGLSNHAQDRLAERYGIDTYPKLVQFSELVLGQEGVHWFPFDLEKYRGPGANANGCRGRKVPWEGKEVWCVVGTHDLTQNPIVVTVLGENGTPFMGSYVETREDATQTPTELQAQNTALTESVTVLTQENLALRRQLEVESGNASNALENLRDARSSLADLLKTEEALLETIKDLQGSLTHYEDLKRGILVLKTLFSADAS